MPPPTTAFDRQLRELEAEIRRLENEYNLFFAGRTAKLPWETRARVEALVKQYDRMHIQNTAERFRFQGLQSRFSAFCELWERHLKQRELGRPGPRGNVAPPPHRDRLPDPPAQPASPPGPAAPPPPGVVALRDAEAQAERVAALYRQLNDARRTVGEGEVPFDRFQEVVRAQISKHARDGAEVAFKVGVQEGRVVFTAKPKKDASEE